jgi:hypothetical protein
MVGVLLAAGLALVLRLPVVRGQVAGPDPLNGAA